MLDREIAEFGRRMGIPTLAFGQNSLLALDVQRMGRLHLEKQEKHGETELLIYLMRPCPAYDSEAPARVLALCHYRHRHPLSLSGGVHKDQIVLLTRLAEKEVTAAAMENAVKFLATVMDRASAS